MKSFSINIFTAILFSCILFVSCEKDSDSDKTLCEGPCLTDHSCCADNNDNTARMRADMKKDDYVEIEVNPVEKIDCYFNEWDKTLLTPVSGLFEYYDSENNWIASIDLGDGTCDQWATKTWSVDVFPDHPEGTEYFPVFKF